MFFDLQSQFEDLQTKFSVTNEGFEVLDNHQLNESTVDQTVTQYDYQGPRVQANRVPTVAD